MSGARSALARTAIAVLALGLAPGVQAAPIRTNTPGTGVLMGAGVTGRFTLTREQGDRERLSETAWLTRFVYTPSTHWIFALEVPYAERTVDVDGLGRRSASGAGDVAVSGKFRFYRRVGRWWDRQAAVEARLELPTGATAAPGDLRLPLRRGLAPGSGSTDGSLDLIYQQAHGRFVQAADFAYRENGDGPGGYRQGSEARLNVDAEYILLPRDYREPGHELFTLLEATVVHREADRAGAERFPETARDEVLLAPGLEYVATERLFLALSVQFPLSSEVAAGGRRSDWNALVEARFSF